MTLHGIPRTTVDLDIMLDLTEENLMKFISCMRDLGLKLKQPVSLKEIMDSSNRKKLVMEKGAIVLTFYNPYDPLEVVDFFIDNPLDFEELYSRRKVIGEEEFRVSVVSLKDLIRMKEITGREQDKMDIEMIRRFLNEEE